MTEIYIISGFLGAGKTTLIQKLLKEAFQYEKIVLIENDFGEISVDATLLKSAGIEVRAISSGCICCSLSGDFVKSVKEILERFHPDKIVIEPSGVGKLSDIIRACEDPKIQPQVTVKSRITVVDAGRCKSYLENFGEFFEDQIENAEVILLSRTDHPDKTSTAINLIRGLNGHAAILSKPWNQTGADEILFPRRDPNGQGAQSYHSGGCECGCHGVHGHDGNGDHDLNHDPDHDHGHNHDHAAEEIFDTVTIRTKQRFTNEELKKCIDLLEHELSGTVLRAKGILRGTSGYIELQYLPGDLKIRSCGVEGDMLNIIGRDLNRRELIDLFKGE